jgi:hypothetical protein
VAVPVNQARKDDVGDVFVPAVNEEVGVKDPLRLGNPGDDGVFTQFGGRRDLAGIGGRGDAFF